MEMLAPKRELPIANAKCINLTMVLGERHALSMEMLASKRELPLLPDLFDMRYL